MIGFSAAAAAMVVAALVLLLRPLLGSRRPGGIGRDALNVTLYRDRLAELEAERDDGLISADDFERARSELQRDLLNNVASDPDSSATGGRPWMIGAVAVAVPAIALLFYLPLGSPNLIEAEPVPVVNDNAGMPDVAEALVELEKRLEAQPDNLEGWLLLGRSLTAMGRHDRAAEVFARAMGAVGEQSELLLGRAEALSLAEGNRLAGEPIALVERVLAREPDHPQALWLAGVHAFQMADFQSAIDHWERVKVQVGEGEAVATVDSAIAEARARLSGKLPAAGAEPATASALEVAVAVASELKGRVQADDTLFIFARAPGSRMPVAAERRRAGELPLTVVLDDSASMSGQPLSGFEKLEVVARISRSGSVRPAPGDLEGRVVTAPGSPATITIDRLLP